MYVDCLMMYGVGHGAFIGYWNGHDDSHLGGCLRAGMNVSSVQNKEWFHRGKL